MEEDLGPVRATSSNSRPRLKQVEAPFTPQGSSCERPFMDE